MFSKAEIVPGCGSFLEVVRVVFVVVVVVCVFFFSHAKIQLVR